MWVCVDVFAVRDSKGAAVFIGHSGHTRQRELEAEAATGRWLAGIATASPSSRDDNAYHPERTPSSWYRAAKPEELKAWHWITAAGATERHGRPEATRRPEDCDYVERRKCSIYRL